MSYPSHSMKQYLFFLFFGTFFSFLVSCTLRQQKEKNEASSSAQKNTDQFVDNTKMTSKADKTLESIPKMDIDSPISIYEIVKYGERVSLMYVKNVPITYPNTYKIYTEKALYAQDIKQIQLNIYNMDGPIAEPEYHRLEKWNNGKWEVFPFRDNLAFAGGGRDLKQGMTLTDLISMSEFKNPLTPGRYKVHFYVYTNIYTYCELTDTAVLPIEDTIITGAFDFKTIQSANDSIHVLFKNHTNLRIQPMFLPSVGTDELYSVHPLARSGWIDEHKWMERHASIEAGRGILFSIPVSWDVKRLDKSPDTERFLSGRLAPGKYKLGLGIEVYMETEFRVE